jgi:hypothetical protein
LCLFQRHPTTTQKDVVEKIFKDVPLILPGVIKRDPLSIEVVMLVVALREINRNETIKVLLNDNGDDDDLIWQILRYAIGGDKSETTDSR